VVVTVQVVSSADIEVSTMEAWKFGFRRSDSSPELEPLEMVETDERLEPVGRLEGVRYVLVFFDFLSGIANEPSFMLGIF